MPMFGDNSDVIILQLSSFILRRAEAKAQEILLDLIRNQMNQR